MVSNQNQGSIQTTWQAIFWRLLLTLLLLFFLGISSVTFFNPAANSTQETLPFSHEFSDSR